MLQQLTSQQLAKQTKSTKKSKKKIKWYPNIVTRLESRPVWRSLPTVLIIFAYHTSRNGRPPPASCGAECLLHMCTVPASIHSWKPNASSVHNDTNATVKNAFSFNYILFESSSTAIPARSKCTLRHLSLARINFLLAFCFCVPYNLDRPLYHWTHTMCGYICRLVRHTSA